MLLRASAKPELRLYLIFAITLTEGLVPQNFAAAGKSENARLAGIVKEIM
jgi:hypothetical protein